LRPIKRFSGSERKVELSDLATRLPFRVNRPGPSYTFNEQYPLSAIAFDEQWIINNFAVRGLQLAAPVAFGIWDKPREIQVTYQDVCIFIAVWGDVPFDVADLNWALLP